MKSIGLLRHFLMRYPFVVSISLSPTVSDFLLSHCKLASNYTVLSKFVYCGDYVFLKIFP